jgi:2-methylcitrate dehydratase PrpD
MAGLGASPGPGEATVWLTGERLPAASAAIVNAYQIHCLEYDCVHEGAVVHPMATILSAVFAWIERAAGRGQTVSGRDLVTALVAGVDVAASIGMAARGAIRFFRPATCGGFGAVAAITKLAGFDLETTRRALGIQYGQTSGTLQPHAEGSPLLGLQIGFNARAAIASCDLAAAGLSGPRHWLTGRYGYLVLYENDDYDFAPVLAQLGCTFQITRLSHKPFPSGRLTHGVVDALGRLVAEGIRADDIVAVECHEPPLVHRLVGRPDIPAPDANYAKLCLPFVAGTFLVHGRVDVPDFRGQERLEDPRVHAAAARVSVILDDNRDPNALDPQRFVVLLADGSVRDIHLARVYGHPDAPLTDAENEAKFRRCAGWGVRPLPIGAADRLVALVAGVETLADAAVLPRATVAG